MQELNWIVDEWKKLIISALCYLKVKQAKVFSSSKMSVVHHLHQRDLVLIATEFPLFWQQDIIEMNYWSIGNEIGYFTLLISGFIIALLWSSKMLWVFQNILFLFLADSHYMYIDYAELLQWIIDE